MTPIQHQNIMVLIEENTERLDLLQKTLAVEIKQSKRLQDIKVQMQKDIAETQRKRLYEGYSASTTTASILDQEDAERRQLLEELAKNSTSSDAPTVKVLNNVQGNLPLYMIINYPYE